MKSSIELKVLFMNPGYKPKMLCMILNCDPKGFMTDNSHNAVHQARSHASIVEERANVLIQEMNARYQLELTRIQDGANQLQYQAHVRS